MKKNTASYIQGLHEDLADPVEAAEYLNAALEDGSQETFFMALKDVADAKGISEIAGNANLNRKNLYRIRTNFEVKTEDEKVKKTEIKKPGNPAAHKGYRCRCFLPDLTEFTILCCAGPGYQNVGHHIFWRRG